MKLKKLIGIPLVMAALLLLTAPVLAASLGVSPSHTELEVPGNGSATASFQVYYFSGDLQVSLVDIPLTVEPDIIHIEPSDEPVDIELTIYGDESLGSQVYDGYVRFLGMSGEAVAVAVEVKAKITNIVEGQPLPEVPGEQSPEQTPPAVQRGAESFPIILAVAGIAAGAAIIITLIVVLDRRRRY